MKINEVIEPETKIEKTLKDYFMFLKMKGIKEVFTKNVVQTLNKKGISVNSDELVNIIDDLDFVQDISGDRISIDGNKLSQEKTSDTDEVKSKDKDFNMDKHRVQSMAKRNLFKGDK